MTAPREFVEIDSNRTPRPPNLDRPLWGSHVAPGRITSSRAAGIGGQAIERGEDHGSAQPGPCSIGVASAYF